MNNNAWQVVVYDRTKSLDSPERTARLKKGGCRLRPKNRSKEKGEFGGGAAGTDTQLVT